MVDRIFDKNGNSVTISNFENEEAARNVLKSNVNCKNCHDCENCIDCTDCEACVGSKGLIGAIDYSGNEDICDLIPTLH